MSNKQSSIERLAELIRLTNKELYAEMFEKIEQAKAMHKTEHFNTWWHGISENEPITFEQYYNETFNK
jgi:hypothetical protein